MAYILAKAKQDELYNAMQAASEALQKYPKGALGLTPDHVKFSDAYQSDALEYNRAFEALRAYNTWFVKTYKKEIQQARNERYKMPE